MSGNPSWWLVKAGSVLATIVAAACTESDEVPPSILLVVVDTLRADHMGTYGYELPTTPCLDAMAAEGLVYERAHATSSWTLPSMASLFSARYASGHGSGVGRDEEGRLVSGDGWHEFRALSPEVQTVAEAFRARGYATAAIVTNLLLTPKFGLDQGFDEWLHQGEATAGAVVDAVLAWFASRPAGPYFTFVHLFDPHMPYNAPGESAGRFTSADSGGGQLPVDKPGKIRKRLKRLSPLEKRFIVHAYDEEVAYVDGELGRMFDALAEMGELERTWVIFTSDHGEEFFEHGGFEHGHAMFEELLHVPLWVRGPDLTPGRSAVPLSLVDLSRALFDIAAGQPPATVFAELGSREPAPFMAEGTLYAKHQEAWFDWPYKLIRRAGRKSLLFDLEADPEEQAPLPTSEENIRMLADLLELQRLETSRAPVPTIAEPDPETMQRLNELGYLGGEDEEDE